MVPLSPSGKRGSRSEERQEKKSEKLLHRASLAEADNGSGGSGQPARPLFSHDADPGSSGRRGWMGGSVTTFDGDGSHRQGRPYCYLARPGHDVDSREISEWCARSSAEGSKER
ncbi:hypothetical protein B7494_g8444 [Chlorociboria aeruginascens]|nr:hypothetical protein B7494_g8444 [Chlorociboria aeruginascens]